MVIWATLGTNLGSLMGNLGSFCIIWAALHTVWAVTVIEAVFKANLGSFAVLEPNLGKWF